MFKTLRTVWNLAARVQECESKFANLESEWTDVLDKLEKREARERMRALRGLRASVEPDQSAGNGSIASSGKSALRAKARASGLLPDPRGGVQ